jgi:hypothetical protein
MAEITKHALGVEMTNYPDDTDRLPAMPAGEALAQGDACAVVAAGTVFKTDGTGTGVFATTAQVHGFCLKKTAVGDPVSLYRNGDLAYAAGLTPGTHVYASGTVKGGLATTPSAANPEPCGLVVTPDQGDPRNRIRIFPTPGRALA